MKARCDDNSRTKNITDCRVPLVFKICTFSSKINDINHLGTIEQKKKKNNKPETVGEAICQMNLKTMMTSSSWRPISRPRKFTINSSVSVLFFRIDFDLLPTALYYAYLY